MSLAFSYEHSLTLSTQDGTFLGMYAAGLQIDVHIGSKDDFSARPSSLCRSLRFSHPSCMIFKGTPSKSFLCASSAKIFRDYYLPFDLLLLVVFFPNPQLRESRSLHENWCLLADAAHILNSGIGDWGSPGFVVVHMYAGKISQGG